MSQEDELIARRACDAALRNDTASVLEHLRCRNSGSLRGSLNTPLLNSTRQAQFLHNSLFQENCAISDDSQAHQQLPEGCRPDHMLRALLMVPPIFESPWLAIFSFIKTIQSDAYNGSRPNPSQSCVRSCLADIQSFLQQTVSSWWENERRSNASNKVGSLPQENARATNSLNITPREWFVRLTKEVIGPLVAREKQATGIAEYRRSAKNDNWMAPLELVSTIVSIIRDFEHSLNQEVLDNVFQLPNIRPDRLLPWLSLATDLSPFLRPCDWKMLLSTLKQRDKYQQYTAFSIQQDLPGLMTSIISLSSTLLDDGGKNKKRSSDKDVFKSWRMLALELLYAASKNMSLFSTVSTVFQESISALSSNSLQEWILVEGEHLLVAGDSTSSKNCVGDSIPEWVRANMILIIMQASQKSGTQLVNGLLSRALSRTTTHCDLAKEGWNKLIWLAFPSSSDSGGNSCIRSFASNEPWIAHMEWLFDGVSYAASGHFRSPRESEAFLLCQTGRLVYSSLFLVTSGQSNVAMDRGSSIYVLERAQGWVSAANNRLKSARGNLSPKDVILVAVILVIVFLEVPKSRSFVVRGMLQSIVGEADFTYSKKEISILHCLVISAIVKSSDSAIEDLKPISDLVAAGNLSREVFFALVKAVANSSETADAAILSASRKRLQCSVGVVWRDDNNSSGSCDRIKCGLYALCILSSSPKCNSCVIEAWKMLSEAIVMNRPPLPLAARSWLFGLIRKRFETDAFGSETVTKKLLRACLLRLLQFVVNAESFSSFAISPQLLLSLWGGPDSRSVQSTLIEDMPELYRLVLALLFRLAPNGRSNVRTQVIKQGRKFVFEACLDTKQKQNSISYPGLSIDCHTISEDPLLDLKLAIRLFACVVTFVLGCASDTEGENADPVRIRTGHTVSSIRNALESQEAAEFELLNLSRHDRAHLMPSWLECPNGASRPTSTLQPPAVAVRNIALSLATLLPILFEDHRWLTSVAYGNESLAAAEQRDLLQSLQVLSSCKQKLSGNDSMHLVGRFAPNTRYESIQSLCNDFGTTLASAMVVVEDAIAKERDFSGFSGVLSVVLDKLASLKCGLHSGSLADFTSTDLSPVLCSLWQLYECICREDAAVRFISYLEGSDMPEGKVCEARVVQVEGPKSLSADTPEDIDLLVRHLRLSVLQTLEVGLILLHKHEVMALRLFTSCSPVMGRPIFRWPDDANTKPIVFLGNCLEQLASDLGTGLEGHSGGLTNDMYQAYVECMGTITKLLEFFVDEARGISDLVPVSTSCVAASAIIQDTMCSYPLHKKSLFQKIFLLCAQWIPHAVLCTSRRALCLISNPDSMDTPALAREVFGSKGEESFAVLTFTHCMETMRSWLRSGMPSDASWAKFSVPRQASDTNCRFNDNSDNSSASQSRDKTRMTGVPSVVTISHHSQGSEARGGRTMIQTGKKLSLTSKDAWNLACSNALLAMENNWLDSYNLLQRRNLSRGSTRRLPLSPSGLWYLNHRTSELLSIKRALGHALTNCLNVLTQRDLESTAAGTSVTTEFLAEIMPTNVKVRLCALIDRMAAVLLVSVKLLDSYVRQPTGTLSELKFLEALSTILAWCKHEQLDGFSFTVQSQKWYTAEQRRMQSSETINFVTEDEVLRRLPKLLFRIEKLESSLPQLLRSLRNGGEKNHLQTEVSERIQIVESAVSQAGENDRPDCFSFQTSIENLVSKISEARSELARTNEADGNANSFVRVGKRKRWQQRKELNRRMHRSRNHTVDEWLRSDQQVGQDEGIDDDAYVDLEDFIVDG